MKKILYLMMLSFLLLPACTAEKDVSEVEEKVVDQPTPDQKEEEAQDEEKEEIEFEVFAEGYTYESPEWDAFKADIETQTGETFTSLAMPASAGDVQLLYVSTSGDYDHSTQKQVNKIYSYHTESKQLTELYQEEENQVLRTMGREGDKLIVLVDNIDNSPGPCASGWYESYKYRTLDLQNPSGLVSFELPQYLIELGQEKDKKCREKNDLGEIK